MVSLYDIDPRRIIMCKNPAFKPEEVFKLYKGFPVVFINAVGKKDEDRYKSGTFYKPLPRPFQMKDLEMLETLDDGSGYYIDVPMQVKEISGTIVRDALLKTSGEDRERIFKDYFGKYDSIIDMLFMSKLKDVKKDDTDV